MDSRIGRALAIGLLLALGGAIVGQQPGGDGPPRGPKVVKPGVSVNDPKAFKGYTLIAPASSTKAHLIDLEGNVVHTWDCKSTPGLSTYLMDNGNLLRPATLGKGGMGFPGAGGKVQEFSWDGALLWDYTFEGKNQHSHHDATLLPNGNILLLICDRKTKDEAIAAGRRPEAAQAGVLADGVIEVKKTGKTTGEVVWEWHSWDHLIQEQDKSKENFDKVSTHPERIDVNYGIGMFAKMVAKKEDLDKLKGLGYFGGPGAMGGFNPSSDWTHINSVDYHAGLDQIMLSTHSFSEIWIIDHGTTTKEAAGKTGGKYGKGGDLLYRWGNPQAYRAGSNADQRLFQQHNAHWIPKGLPGAGNILVFNNGDRRPDGRYSSVDEIVPPLTKSGTYERKAGVSFGPSKAAWSYTAPTKSEFFAPLISGAHRLPNGDTLICSGTDSTVFEVTADKEIVWKLAASTKGGFGPGGFGPGGFGPPRVGEILPKFMQQQLKLTADQEKELEAIQKDVDSKLDKMLTEVQREQLKKMRQGFGPPGGFGFPGFGSPPPGGGGPGGPGGPGGLFRSYRYAVDHPAFQGKTLTPGKKLNEM